MTTPNSAADFIFEKMLSEHDATKSLTRELEEKERQLTHLRSMLRTEVNYSRSTREKLQAAQEANRKLTDENADLKALLATAEIQALLATAEIQALTHNILISQLEKSLAKK